MENKQLVSPSRQCSSTPIGFDQAFLSKEQCYNNRASPDLAAVNFYLFPILKSALEGRHIFYATDIIKNAMEELKRFSRNGFQGCFQNLYSRWQKYIVARGDYFEGNVASMIVLFCVSHNKIIPRIFCSCPLLSGHLSHYVCYWMIPVHWHYRQECFAKMGY
jgi:hypothetical protein